MKPGKPSTPRVLFADDDRSIRQLLCTIVRRERFDADCVADGIQAIEKLKEHRYAVILLDLMMPRANGFEVIDYLKQHPPAIKPIVLVITAYSDPRVEEVDSSVVAGVLRKPFEVADLGSLVRLCIKGFFDEETQWLYESKDPSIRDFVRFQIRGTRPRHGGENKGKPN
jgi:CheY-like chemotaxis protein